MKIALKVENANNALATVSSIRKITGLSITEIQQRLESHGVIAEFLLFYNDHDEVAERLRRLVDVIPPNRG